MSRPTSASTFTTCSSPDLMLMVGTTRLAQEVHAAWRDGMLNQNRPVAQERMTWDTLSEQDKELDKYIGQRLATLLIEALGANPWPAAALPRTKLLC